MTTTPESDFDLLRESLEHFFENLHLLSNKSGLTHNLHPYPAKFVPQIPRALIKAFGRPGWPVLDPMCGSGTALVEASQLGYQSIGVDLNPIAALVSRAKTSVIGKNEDRELSTLLRILAGVTTANGDALLAARGSDAIPTFLNRDKWFEKQATAELGLILSHIHGLTSAVSRIVALCAFSAIIVRASNQESETRWCAKKRQLRAGDVINSYTQKLSRSILRLRQFAQLSPTQAYVYRADARQLPIASASVGLVVTSPPYANSHDYYLYNKLRMFWLRQNVRLVQANEIGSRHRHSDKREDIGSYLEEMTAVFSEIFRVLEPGGHAAVVVADAVVRKELHRMDELLGPVGSGIGLRLIESYQFDHTRFNATFQRGFGTRHSKVTHVLVFKRQ